MLENHLDKKFINMQNQIGIITSQIKNGKRAGLKTIELNEPLSKTCFNILNVLYKEGFINGFFYKNTPSNEKKFVVLLKYNRSGQSVIKNIKQISRPGKRIYTNIKVLWKVKNGFGVFILSTPKGIMTDFDARLLNLGGEVLLSIT